MSNVHSIIGYKPEGRPKNDYYPTPTPVINALLDVERFIPGVYEPACGDGNIVSALDEYGYFGACSDIDEFPDGPGTVADFLEIESMPDENYSIVTNPPFRLFSEFALHAYEIGSLKTALFGKIQALEGVKRSRILVQAGLSRVHVFRKRVSLYREGNVLKNSGMMTFAWFVFEPQHRVIHPTIHWIG